MLDHFKKDLLQQMKNKHLHRVRRPISRKVNTRVIINGTSLINFCSNDYLNLSHHAQVKKALIRGAEKHGLGSSSSAAVSGYTQAHMLLEEEFAAFLKRDRALLFNSGYHANLGVLTTFAERHHVILGDKYCHASLNDGALLSYAAFHRFRHQDLLHAETLLKQFSLRHPLLITESIFCMQGSLSEIKKLSALALTHQAFFIVDDAHGIGILGKTGAGASEHFQLTQKEIPCLVTPLGKALGSMGAIVSGEHGMIEALLQCAKTYRYSTALPPSLCEATRASLKVMQNETWRREKLIHLCQFFSKEAGKRNLSLASHDVTPIKSILIPSAQHALALQSLLFEKGLFISCIRPPTVPAALTCIRVSLNCMHDEKQIIFLLDQIKEQYDKLQRQTS